MSLDTLHSTCGNHATPASSTCSRRACSGPCSKAHGRASRTRSPTDASSQDSQLTGGRCEGLTTGWPACRRRWGRSAPGGGAKNQRARALPVVSSQRLAWCCAHSLAASSMPFLKYIAACAGAALAPYMRPCAAQRCHQQPKRPCCGGEPRRSELQRRNSPPMGAAGRRRMLPWLPCRHASHARTAASFALA